MSVTRRGLIWEILNSWWIILSFLGFSFISFLYIGTKSRTTKWKVAGVLYFLIFVVAIVLAGLFSYDPVYDFISTIAVGVWMASLLVGFIHSFLVRKEYLIRRDYILTNGIEDQELDELRKSVKQQYKGKDYIEASGNDTHFDDSYHSKMEYRDYDTISAKPNDDQDVQFEDYYDQSIVRDNEEILDNSKYVTYSKKNKEGIRDDGRIDINSCSVDQLMELPGVNQEIANKAVSLREMLGGFNSVQEFVDMMHIDAQYLEQIQQKSTIR